MHDQLLPQVMRFGHPSGACRPPIIGMSHLNITVAVAGKGLGNQIPKRRGTNFFDMSAGQSLWPTDETNNLQSNYGRVRAHEFK